MAGGSPKSRKRESKKMLAEKKPSEMASSLATDASCALSDFPTLSQSTASTTACTPKRRSGRIRLMQEASLTSTPVHSSSNDRLCTIFKSPPGDTKEDLENTTPTRQLEIPEMQLPCSTPKSQSRQRKRRAVQPRQGRKRAAREKTQSCSNSGPLAKIRQRRGQKVQEGEKQKQAATQPPNRCRPRFELMEPEVTEQDRVSQDDTELSSELSIELSHHEDLLASFSLLEDEEEEEEDEEELPSFLMREDQKPLPITEGVFVWCKFRNYPFWPAMVKTVYRKMKKASIVFIDDPRINKSRKGITVALKTLKPFDCQEAKQLVCTAEETHSTAIKWCLDLITDYRFRIGCGSFSGSFIEYFAHDMSYPVRKMYPQAESERLTIASETEEQCEDYKEESSTELKEEVIKSSKRLLPDRTHAAHNRANKKLVHFIVKQRMVDNHLLAVISGQQQSRWLRSFLNTKRRQIVNVYLEDDQQLDQVFRYLNELHQAAPATAPCLVGMKFMQCVAFVLDVLLPEAIICAIAGVDKVSIQIAEEKYLKGRRISNREREEFDWMIEQQMKTKSTCQNTTHPHTTSPP